MEPYAPSFKRGRSAVCRSLPILLKQSLNSLAGLSLTAQRLVKQCRSRRHSAGRAQGQSQSAALLQAEEATEAEVEREIKQREAGGRGAAGAQAVAWYRRACPSSLAHQYLTWVGVPLDTLWGGVALSMPVSQKMGRSPNLKKI